MPEQTSTSSQQRFRKRPVVIDAIQFDGSNYSAVFGFMAAALPAGTHSAEGSIFIPTLEGLMRADKGDWIICGVKGEFYPCKPDIFEKTYEPA